MYKYVIYTYITYVYHSKKHISNIHTSHIRLSLILFLMLLFFQHTWSVIRFTHLSPTNRLAQQRLHITQAHEEGPNILGGNVHRMPRSQKAWRMMPRLGSDWFIGKMVCKHPLFCKMMRKHPFYFAKDHCLETSAMFENLGVCFFLKCVLKIFTSSSTPGIYAVFILHGHITSILLASVTQLETQVRRKHMLKIAENNRQNNTFPNWGRFLE